MRPFALPALEVPPARSVAAVIDRMRAIDVALPTADGVAWFNKLYLRTTESVALALTDGRFSDPGFLPRLTVVFANLYFAALRRLEHDPERVPKAWAALFEARARPGVAPIQFALAGMNAHINRDLPVAVADTCRRLDIPLDARRREDFRSINGILEETQEQVKRWFATGFFGVVDDALGRTDDIVSIWSLTQAREAAWVNASTLTLLRGIPLLAASFLATLDRSVGFAGRGLLTPVA